MIKTKKETRKGSEVQYTPCPVGEILHKNLFPNTELGVNLKTLLRSDRCMQTGKDYLGILRRDSDGETDEFLYRDPHITFIETMLWTSKRNPYLFRGKYITVTHRDDGSLHLNFKYLKLGAGFNIEGYALEVANEIRVALKGLIEEK